MVVRGWWCRECEGARECEVSGSVRVCVGGARVVSFPVFFCSSVSVDNNTQMRKGSEKRGRPGIIHHVLYVK